MVARFSLKRSITAAFLVLGIVFAGAKAEATVISFSGTTGFTANALAGLSWSLTADLNDNATDTNTAGITSAATGDFSGADALNSLSLTLDGETVSAGPTGFSIRAKNFSGNPGSFSITARDFGSQTLQGLSIAEMNLGFNPIGTGSPFTDPNDLGPALADFVSNIAQFTQNPSNSRLFLDPTGSQFTSLLVENVSIASETLAVAEPATLALFGLGLAGIGFTRRRST